MNIYVLRGYYPHFVEISMFRRYNYIIYRRAPYCTQPSLPKKRKGPNKYFTKNAEVLSRSDDDEDNNKYLRDDFVVDNGAEVEEDEASMPQSDYKWNENTYYNYLITLTFFQTP